MKKTISAGLLTLLVAILFVGLGFWQLARLDQRKALNAQVEGRLALAPLALTGADLGEAVDDLKYRPVTAQGTYDYEHEQAVFNQYYQGQLGLRLVTPLVIAGSEQAVMVDRGWIPDADSAPARWAKYAEGDSVEVRGWLMPGTDGSGRQAQFSSLPRMWLRIDTQQMQALAGHALLPVYIQPGPKANANTPPIRSDLAIDLSEGPHLGYAITWCGLAVAVTIGYFALLKSGRLKETK